MTDNTQAELREQLAQAYRDGYSTKNNTDDASFQAHLTWFQDFITADRKRVALEEREKARKFYAKRRPQFTKTWAADVLGVSRPTLDKWLKNPEQFTIGAVIKLAELKAQQEEIIKKGEQQ